MTEIDVKSVELFPFKVFDEDCCALNSGNEKTGFNSMTVSWGGLGTLWGGPVATVYVRPQRFTKRLMDENDIFSVSVMGKKFRKEMGYLGSATGANEDKIKKCGLTPVYSDETVYFDEAKYVFICKKAFRCPMEENDFVDKDIIERWYNGDYHEIYIGEIIKVLKSDDALH